MDSIEIGNMKFRGPSASSLHYPHLYVSDIKITDCSNVNTFCGWETCNQGRYRDVTGYVNGASEMDIRFYWGISSTQCGTSFSGVLRVTCLSQPTGTPTNSPSALPSASPSISMNPTSFPTNASVVFSNELNEEMIPSVGRNVPMVLLHLIGVMFIFALLGIFSSCCIGHVCFCANLGSLRLYGQCPTG